MSQYNSAIFENISKENVKHSNLLIVSTEWNAHITDELRNGAVSCLNNYGITNIETLKVPGAIELPFAIKNYYTATQNTTLQPHAIIAIGCVIKGTTPHFEYVCQSITQSITQLNLELPIPTIFGVLTVNTEAQAHDRIGGTAGHKGTEAALTALKMIQLNAFFKNLKND
jgi:6,7-dimethyl-8-ribityllumazine synthase